MNARSKHWKLSAIGFLLFPLLLSSGCGTSQENEKTPLLPEAGLDERNFSPDQSKSPYVEAGKGLLTRTVFETDALGDLHVEVRDLLVGPGQTTVSVSLPGATIFEVRLGSGTVFVNGKPRQIQTGSTMGVSEGESFVIENKGENPIAIRVHLIHSK
jgi:hypothetical protein